ncbi:MAG: hypothetical protein NTV06_06435 [candidate division Zixibacteria bacterium]|nr:hypothetical protein [candidate division Zixibacteria bacterium]
MKLNGGKKLSDQSISIGADWVFTPSITFYKIKHHLTWLKWPDWKGPGGYFDYYYLLPDKRVYREREASRDIDVSQEYHLTSIHRFDLAGTSLAVRRNDTGNR